MSLTFNRSDISAISYGEQGIDSVYRNYNDANEPQLIWQKRKTMKVRYWLDYLVYSDEPLYVEDEIDLRNEDECIFREWYDILNVAKDYIPKWYVKKNGSSYNIYQINLGKDMSPPANNPSLVYGHREGDTLEQRGIIKANESFAIPNECRIPDTTLDVHAVFYRQSVFKNTGTDVGEYAYQPGPGDFVGHTSYIPNVGSSYSDGSVHIIKKTNDSFQSSVMTVNDGISAYSIPIWRSALKNGFGIATKIGSVSEIRNVDIFYERTPIRSAEQISGFYFCGMHNFTEISSSSSIV